MTTPTRESDIEKYLVAQVLKLGGEVRKVKWVGRDGAPDRLVMLPSRQAEIVQPSTPVKCPPRCCQRAPETLWIELKAPGLAATFPANAHERQQHREHERMRRMGQRVEVIDSFDGVDEVLK